MSAATVVLIVTLPLNAMLIISAVKPENAMAATYPGALLARRAISHRQRLRLISRHDERARGNRN